MDGENETPAKRTDPHWFKLVFSEYRRRWHTWQGLLLLITLAGGSAGYAVLNFCGEMPLPTKIAAPISAVTLAIIGWAIATRVPRCARGTIGIALVFTYDDESQAKRLRADFVQKLREHFRKWHSQPAVDIVEFPEWLSEKLVRYDEDQLMRLATKARCLLLLSGQAKVRSLDTKVHVIEFKGLVRHRPIEQKTQRTFAEEFRELFPKSVVSAFKGDFIAMAVTAEWLDVVARYIVSSAAALSGDMDYSASQFRELINRLKEPTNFEIVNKIRKRLPIRLASVLKAKLSQLYDEYARAREKKWLTQMESIASELEKLEPGCYAALVSAALVQFSLYRNVERAKQLIEKCAIVEDAAWMWSKAFLHAYEGDLDSAYRTYLKAFAAPSENTRLAVECEEFIHLVLEEERDRQQLLFALGMINHRAKGDLTSAKADFETFVKWASRERRFPTQVDAAEKWIREIRNEPKANPLRRNA